MLLKVEVFALAFFVESFCWWLVVHSIPSVANSTFPCTEDLRNSTTCNWKIFLEVFALKSPFLETIGRVTSTCWCFTWIPIRADWLICIFCKIVILIILWQKSFRRVLSVTLIFWSLLADLVPSNATLSTPYPTFFWQCMFFLFLGHVMERSTFFVSLHVRLASALIKAALFSFRCIWIWIEFSISVFLD